MVSELIEALRLLRRRWSLSFAALLLLAADGVGTVFATSYPVDVSGNASGPMALIVSGPIVVFASALELLSSGSGEGGVIVGTALGTWFLSLPFWACASVLYGWVGPGYYGRHVDVASERLWRPQAASFIRMTVTRTVAGAIGLAAGFFGAVPGLLLSVFLAERDQAAAGGIALLGAVVGGAVAYVVTRLSLAFAERVAVFERVSTLTSLRRSYSMAKGHRGELLQLWALTWAIEVAAAVPWLLLIGLFTHPPGRLLSDILWTRAYVRYADEKPVTSS